MKAGFDRIAGVFNRSGATRAVALDISKAFDRFLHAVRLHKLNSYGNSGQIFGHISTFLCNRASNNSRWEILKAPFMVLFFSYYT